MTRMLEAYPDTATARVLIFALSAYVRLFPMIADLAI